MGRTSDTPLKAGQSYYLKVDIVTGFWKGGGRMTYVAAEQGEWRSRSRLDMAEKVGAQRPGRPAVTLVVTGTDSGISETCARADWRLIEEPGGSASNVSALPLRVFAFASNVFTIVWNVFTFAFNIFMIARNVSAFPI